MTYPDQARAADLSEVERLKNAIREHRAQKADDRCIEDDDRLYATLGDGIKCDRRVGDKAEMLRNCARFIERRCEGGKWLSYRELEGSVEAHRRALRQVVEVLATRTNDALDRALTIAEVYMESSPPYAAQVPAQAPRPKLTVHDRSHAVMGLEDQRITLRAIEGQSDTGSWRASFASEPEAAAFLLGVTAATTLLGGTVEHKMESGVPFVPSGAAVCPVCGGKGFTETDSPDTLARMMSQTQCARCRGAGKV